LENDAKIPPILAQKDNDPIAMFRTHVGKSSDEYRYSIENAADTNIRPDKPTAILALLLSKQQKS